LQRKMQPREEAHAKKARSNSRRRESYEGSRRRIINERRNVHLPGSARAKKVKRGGARRKAGEADRLEYSAFSSNDRRLKTLSSQSREKKRREEKKRLIPSGRKVEKRG